MNFETIRWENERVVLIDQTKLPDNFVERSCDNVEDLHDAIRVLAVRGAPLLGVTAAFGLCLAVKDYAGSNVDAFLAELEASSKYIKSSRPTAVNLFWALDRMLKVAKLNTGKAVFEIKEILFNEAREIKAEDEWLCRKIGEAGESLIEEGDVVLTHCNAGALATAGIGTALAPMYVAHENGKKFKVYADETRPLLQGGRLTAWELAQNGIDVTVQCDNMVASLMSTGVVKKVITGTDRVAANGDTANKIGTFGVAIMAKYFNVPFYIAGPYSTFDFDCPIGTEIPIENRSEKELKYFANKQIAPLDANVFNPAFDVTPNELITGFITEKGIIRPPYSESLKALQNQKRH